MRTLHIDHPESVLSVLNLAADDFEHEARVSLAVKLYERGRLTSGQAAELARIPRVQFLLSCRHYGADSVRWDDEELVAEFEGNRV